MEPQSRRFYVGPNMLAMKLEAMGALELTVIVSKSLIKNVPKNGDGPNACGIGAGGKIGA
jgi:hypothetical protein